MEVPGIDIHSQWLCFSDWILTHMLPNQTWVHSPCWNKASLLTPGCGEGKCSIYCKAKQGAWATNAQKAWTSPFTKRYFKDSVREKVLGCVISSWPFFWLVGGKVIGSQHHQPSGSSQSGVYVLEDRMQLTSSIWWGLQCLQNTSKNMAQNII